MSLIKENEIYSAREFDVSVEVLYQAFANPIHLKNWWGPEGFTNTIHEFNLQENGKWLLTMHGPDKGNYVNSSRFKIVISNRLISWTRLSQPLFDMEVGFEQLSNLKSRISFRMIFNSVNECDKMKKFVLPKNEENFDRLARELKRMTQN